jgi:aminoglycoside phosphotransferase (APT) family kinase protein
MSLSTSELRRVAAHLGLTGGLRSRLLTGGRSNLTYELIDEAGRRRVLRVPPRGTRADIAREYSILEALANSPVPVPQVEALCVEPPFYVAEFVDGAVLNTRDDGARLDLAARAVASHSIVDALARIHAVDVNDVGLHELGRGTGYLDRQLQRWSAQAARRDALSGPLLLEVHEALSADVPVSQRTCLVHGDYKFPNVMIDAETGVVCAVLDWELATLGDPLADLGNLLAMWPDPDEPALFDSPTSNEGFLTRADVVENYAAQSGLDTSAAWWYEAFAIWKVACLLAGVVARYRDGAMAEDDFDVDEGAELVGKLGQIALAKASQQPAASARPLR